MSIEKIREFSSFFVNRQFSTFFDIIRRFSTKIDSGKQETHGGDYYDSPPWVNCARIFKDRQKIGRNTLYNRHLIVYNKKATLHGWTIKDKEMPMLQKKNKGRTSKRPSMEELSELYSRLTAKQIAEQFAVSDSTVRHWIATYRKQLEVSKDVR